jgi:ubiquinone/menaquinone biosynthesis C-methylase UbiE
MALDSVLRERRGADIHNRSTVNIRSAPQMREYRAIAERVAADRPARVLDWGCGRGQMTSLMRERGLDVTAFDYRPGIGGVATVDLEHFAIRADVSDDPVALPYPDGSFDAVLSCGVLEHVADKAGSLAELRRVLSPSGTLYVFKLPNRHSYLEAIARRLGLYHHGSNPLDTL